MLERHELSLNGDLLWFAGLYWIGSFAVLSLQTVSFPLFEGAPVATSLSDWVGWVYVSALGFAGFFVRATTDIAAKMAISFFILVLAVSSPVLTALAAGSGYCLQLSISARSPVVVAFMASGVLVYKGALWLGAPALWLLGHAVFLLVLAWYQPSWLSLNHDKDR